MKLLAKLARVREVEDGHRGESHHLMGKLHVQQLGVEWIEVGDRASGVSMARGGRRPWGSLWLQLRRCGGGAAHR